MLWFRFVVGHTEFALAEAMHRTSSGFLGYAKILGYLRVRKAVYAITEDAAFFLGQGRKDG
jgi:hypothetical protein